MGADFVARLSSLIPNIIAQNDPRLAAMAAMHLCPRCLLRYLNIRDRRIINSFAGTDALSQPAGDLDSTTNAGNSQQSPINTHANGLPAPSSSSSTSTALPTLPSMHSTPPTPQTSHSSTDPFVIKPLPTVCPACLGTLQVDQSGLATQCVTQMQQAKYRGVETFVVAARVPMSLPMRHRAVMLAVARAVGKESIPAIDVKEMLKTVMIEAIERCTPLKYDAKSPFTINLEYTHLETDSEVMALNQIQSANFRVKKARKGDEVIYHGATTEKIASAVQKVSFDDLSGAGHCPPKPVVTWAAHKISMLHAPVYVAGRYTKLQRNISNSPFVIGGQRKAQDSVEELLDVDYVFLPTSHKFSSAGREDVDVKMLGKGRPFYFEMIDPKIVDATQDELSAAQARINEKALGKVGCRDLQVVSKDDTRILKDSAATKCKSYRALVQLSKLVDAAGLETLGKMTDLAIEQRNPTRVPRRADLVRDKVIHSMSATFVDPAKHDQCYLDLRTSAGTYIKEFINGDEGRTTPSLTSLLNVEWARCVELDVTEVELDWPPALESGSSVGDEREGGGCGV